MLNVYHLGCLFFGYFITIGIGSLLQGDEATFMLLMKSILVISIGWIFVPASSIQISVLSKKSNFKKYKIHFLVIVFCGVFAYIGFRYGFPLLSNDATESRLLQRTYFIAMGFVYVIVPLLSAYSYVLWKNKRISPFYFYFVMLLILIGSSLLAVRYVWLEGIVLLAIISLYLNKFNSWIKGLIPLILIVCIFFILIQWMRSTNPNDSLLFDKLISRAFFINYDVFYVSVSEAFNMQVTTYQNAFNKLLGNGGYNLGFLLFSKIEGNTLIQGYAPVSMIGEVYINYGQGLIAYLVLFLLGSFLRVVYQALMCFFRGEYLIVFIAYFGLELLRSSAHSVIGMLIAIISFSVGLFLIQQISFLIKKRILLDGG